MVTTTAMNYTVVSGSSLVDFPLSFDAMGMCLIKVVLCLGQLLLSAQISLENILMEYSAKDTKKDPREHPRLVIIVVETFFSLVRY